MKQVIFQNVPLKTNTGGVNMKTIEATMAGMVLNVLVEGNEEVQVGQVVVMLESMKMEIPIESAVSGTVKEIKAVIGDFVNEGDALLILE